MSTLRSCKYGLCAHAIFFAVLFFSHVISAFAYSYKLEIVGFDRSPFSEVKNYKKVEVGESFSGEVMVKVQGNPSRGETLRGIELSAVDGTMTSNGFLGLASQTDEQIGFGKVVTVGEAVKTQSGEFIAPFTVTVPELFTPGQTAGAIVMIPDLVNDSAPNLVSEGHSSEIKVRYAVTAILDLEGEYVSKLEIADMDVLNLNDGRFYDFKIKNVGNVVAEVSGDLTTRSLFGRNEYDIIARKILPGGFAHVSVPIKKGLYPFGESFTLNVDVTFLFGREAKKDVLIAKRVFRHFSYIEIFILLLVLFPICLLVVKLFNRKSSL